MLVLAHGVPSHDTFSRVFRLLDPQAFDSAFRQFMQTFAENVQGVVALDGKALRRAYDSGKSHMPPIMVTAWGAQTRMALANVLAEGNNEAAAALQLIGLLTLKGCVVTADALHCHRAMAAAIVEQGGDYAIAVKDNRHALLLDAKAAVGRQRARAPARPSPSTIVMAATKPGGGGRRGRRNGRAARVPRPASGCKDHQQA